MAAYDVRYETNQVGQVDDTSIRRVDSYSANTNLQFGVCVTIDSVGGNYGVEPWLPNTFAFGITAYDPNQIEGNYKTDKMCSVLTFGRIIVTAVDDVQPGESAYVKTGGVLGGKPAAPTTNELFVGYWLSPAEAGGKAMLQFTPNSYD